ncbi:MAG: DNA alkylation repair protein [Bacteroidales bacterium]|nr:DNA alkylation repair protein [Bacteroidales bacterium]
MFQLKDYVSISFISRVSTVIEEIAVGFDKKKFKKLIFDKKWEKKELKQRTHHIAKILKTYLDKDYKIASKQLIEIAKGLQKVEFRHETIGLLFVPDFIEDYGIQDFNCSMTAIEEVTKLMSCEFAVRPFYNSYPNEMFAKTIEWTKNKDHRIRRLASEGCRSKLPWANAEPYLKNNPQKVMEVLELLYNDEHKWVRLSVSNNLNDISKEHPEIILDFAKKHIGEDIKTDKMLKHGLRTLLKNGNVQALNLFGFIYSDKLILKDFTISSEKIKLGTELKFNFSIFNSGNKNEKIRVEYLIYYQKANGTLSPKMYHISEKEITAAENIHFSKKRSFKLITTRKFHLGLHKIGIIINGKEIETLDFELENY